MKHKNTPQMYELNMWSSDLPDGDPVRTLFINRFPKNEQSSGSESSRTDHAEALAKDAGYIVFKHVRADTLRELKYREDLVPFEENGCAGFEVKPISEEHATMLSEAPVVDAEPVHVRRPFIDQSIPNYGIVRIASIADDIDAQKAYQL